VLLPVAVRNYAVGGGFYLTTSQFGSNFYIGNNPKATGTYMPLREGRGTPEYERQDATELAERAAGHSLTPAEVSSYWTGQALGYITGHSAAWAKLMGRKIVLLLNATEAVDTESQETYAESSFPLAALGWIGHFGLVVPLALLGMLLAWPERRRLWILYALTASYAASILLFYIVARYRFPLVPMLILFAAEGVMRIPAFVRGTATSHARRLAVAAAVIAAVVFANWPALSAAPMQAVTEVNLGAELQAQGRTDEAIAHYRRATGLAPSNPSTFLNLGTALREQGRTNEAIEAYRRALSISPDDGDAHYNLANALMDAHRIDEALTHFAFAAKASPGSADVQNNFGIALAEAGKPSEAAAAFERAVQADPNSAKAHRNLSDMLSALGRSGEALDQLRQAVAIDPGDASLHYDLGRTLLDAGSLPEAEAEFRRALALQPSMAEAHNNLGATLAFERKYAEAIAEFEETLRLNPNAEDAKRNLAAVRSAQGRP
jgi:tetratricopeptide (TPR) repeat protein